MIYKESDFNKSLKEKGETNFFNFHSRNKDSRTKVKYMKFVKDYSLLALSILLVVAGYMSYLSKYKSTTSVNSEANKVADIGDATLVNSNDLEANDSSVLDDENKDTSREPISAIQSTEENTESSIISTNADTTSGKEAEEKKKVNDYFISSKMERDNMYSQQIESYQKIIENPNCSAIQRNEASERIDEINQIKNSIMIAENLIKTKGFEDCIIFINSDSANIIIRKEELSKEDIAKIQNIASRELSKDVNNIHISNKY